PALGVAVALDQDIDAVVANQARGLGVAECAEVAPMRERGADAFGGRALVGSVTVAVEFEAGAIVLLEQAGHQAPGGMIAKVAGEVADAQARAAWRRR